MEQKHANQPRMRWMALAAGLLFVGLVYLLPLLLIRSLGGLVGAFGRQLGLSAGEAEQVRLIFGQMRSAAVQPPLAPAAACFLTAGLLSCWACRTGRRIAAGLLMLLLLISAVMLSLWHTQVNGLRVGVVAYQLFRALKAGVM